MQPIGSAQRGVSADVRSICGQAIAVRKRRRAIAEIGLALQEKRALKVAFANANLLYYALHDAALSKALPSFLLLNDGVAVDMMSRLLYGAAFEENLNGTDFVPRLLRGLAPGTRVYFVGGKPGVARRTAEWVKWRIPGIIPCGADDGYNCHGAQHIEVLARIEAARADLVLVAMGNPLQEIWIDKADSILPNKVWMGVGALFDFLSHEHPRAPRLLRQLRLEWAFRLYREPQRLLRRYTIEVFVVFVAAVTLRLFPNRRKRPSYG